MRCLLAVIVPLLFLPTSAFAHASDRGHVLLLPTGYYLLGGAVAVAISFLVLALLPASAPARLWRRRLSLFEAGEGLRLTVSLLSFAVFAALVMAGFTGSRDPLSNPLPLTIWTLIWAGLVLVQGLLGDVWRWLNPWYGPWRLAAGLLGPRAPWRLPAWLGCWPAFVLFFAFAWFELVDPAPDDPARLAMAAGLYWLVSFVAMLAFGYRPWSRKGEFLTLFFAMVARFGVVERTGRRLALCLPGAKLFGAAPLAASGTAFILLALSSVSFDGLSKTFFWLGRFGVNPLDYPGRTALMGIGAFGLVLTFLLLAGAFLAAVWLGQRLAGDGVPFGRAAGLLVWSIVPIALAYHVAHYLTALLVDGQYALVALSDPFARGWNLVGTAHLHVSAGVVAGAHSAWWLWNVQAGAIVAGHVLAVLVAHGLAARLHGGGRGTVLSQVPLTLLMVAYTVFGLWLLSAPAV
ncbi:MAG: hypothetical protein ACTHNH_11930 [Mesorhizobium sp.]